LRISPPYTFQDGRFERVIVSQEFERRESGAPAPVGHAVVIETVLSDDARPVEFRISRNTSIKATVTMYFRAATRPG
jgi:hypothetical protein